MQKLTWIASLDVRSKSMWTQPQITGTMGFAVAALPLPLCWGKTTVKHAVQELWRGIATSVAPSDGYRQPPPLSSADQYISNKPTPLPGLKRV